jgi:DNA adenine methylase
MTENEIMGVLRQLQRGQNAAVSLHAEIGGTPGETPILRWAGSKKRLLSQLLLAAQSVDMARYIEPFMGSGALFLKLNPQSAVLSDINPHLIAAYEGVRDFPEQVWSLVMSWPVEDAFYYQLRAVRNELLTDIEQAARFVYLNRYCFNGVYRTNLKGQFNVARGQGNLGIPSWPIFRDFAHRLNLTTLTQCDFEVSLALAGAGDLVYIDPPYLAEGKRDRGEYGAGVFGPADLGRLLRAMKAADERGAKILMSYTPCKRVLDALSDWHVHQLSVMRNVSSKTTGRAVAAEIIVSNYEWNDAPGNEENSDCDCQ